MSDRDRSAELRKSRGAVYGDPRENHRGIAQAWAGILQPHARGIAGLEPLPEHAVALMMAALKLNRMRRVFHQDNYDDLRVYLGFAETWQRDHAPAPVRVHRVYVAGPYSAPTLEGREANVARAVEAAAAIMAKGHDAHCPHSATHPVEQANPGGVDYERWMRLDFGIIRHWATAVFCVGPSPGADRECELAHDLGLPVWRTLDEVPAAEGE